VALRRATSRAGVVTGCHVPTAEPTDKRAHPAFRWSSGPWQILAENLTEEQCDTIGARETFSEMIAAGVALAFGQVSSKARK